MHEYDVTLKSVLTGSVNTLLRQIGYSGTVEKWLNVELPRVQNQRVDLLLQLSDGRILHIELQSTNDPDMPLRMLEYAIAIRRLFGQFPLQLVLHVGNPKLSMDANLRNGDLDFRYSVLDIREIDGELLLASEEISENLLAILARNADQRGAIRRIIARIARLDPGRREDALRKLLILSGLRKLAKTVEQEKANMPVTFDIMENEVLGPVMREGIAKGMEQGREEGIEQGREEGLRQILRTLLIKRFGPLPAWAESRLSSSTAPEANEFALRLLDAKSLQDLFRL